MHELWRGSRVATSRRRLEKEGEEEEEEMLLAIWNDEDDFFFIMVRLTTDSKGKFFTVMAPFSRKRRPTLEINHPRD